MNPNSTIHAPFFEIGPKSYLYGDDVTALAKAADAASEKYQVDIIFTTPIVEIARVKALTKHIHVFAAPYGFSSPRQRSCRCSS